MAKKKTNIKRLGRYELHEEIGRGGMATVFRGYDSSLRRNVAVKVLHPHLISHQEARERFEREARSVAKLHHHSIVEIYDYAESESGEVYIVMELVEGYTLRDFLNQRDSQPIIAEGALLIGRQIFVALKMAHAECIIHRDVKPENILISNDGKIQLSDFGIASLAGIGQMTATGQILGSPTYMSPEHIESPSVDFRADIFSVGTILYEMAVGSTPFVGNNPHQIIKRVVEGYYDHPLSLNPSVGHPVASVIVKCLQAQPDRRYQTAQEAIEEIETILSQVGIADWDNEQLAFLKNPSEWEEEKTPNIVEKTLMIGKAAQKNRQLPEAMNHLNRVLAIEPTNEIALSAVNVLSKRRQLRRTLERIGGFSAIAVILLAAALAFIFYRYSQSSQVQADDAIKDPTGPGLEVETLLESNDSAETDTTQSEDTGAAKKVIIIQKDSEDTENSPEKFVLAADEEKKRKAKIKPEAEPSSRKVIFNPQPMSVDVVIDDTKKFTFKATDRERELPVGTHVIKYVPIDNRLEPMTQTINLVPSEKPYTVAARLQWKPARLLVRSNVDTDVAVNGRSLGKTNLPMELDIKKGPNAQFRILLSAKGYHPIEKLVSVSAGKMTEIVVHLEKE
ncbi:MAG: serine/threonine protein kinase [Deltaproteobacteria bacterium]|nr:serine/threonine protein kinase [Deltaproteobacteria bacterium]MBN2670029.1 serine/threonine protein kinase [Deltaproteobacteria bacterium]